jgi:hypothetical protein
MRLAAAAAISLAAVVLAAGCGGGSGSAKSIGPKELERDLAAQSSGVTAVSCGAGARGWTYICHFTDSDGARKKIGFVVDGASVDRRSAQVPEGASLATLRTPPPGAYANLADGIESACLERNNELNDLGRPKTKKQFALYVVSLLNISHYYRGQLAKLHPEFRAGDRKVFAEYLRLLRSDEAAAVALMQAVRRSNRRAVVRLVGEQSRRSTREQALLSRLGVSCH